MNILEITPLILALSFGAGFLGSLTGLGGGVIVIPALTLLFGVDIHYAIGASLVSVIATSSGAAAAYVREGFTNIRIGMFLESATTVGALLGASLAARLPEAAISVIFGAVLVFSGIQTIQSHEGEDGGDGRPLDKIATFLRMHSSYPSPEGSISYHVRRVPGGMALMMIAGGLSGLLGIGSGAFKVLAMDRVMRIPFKVSTTTSNFMIGVTAAASAGVYLNRGYVDPGLAMPVMLGVLAGSLFGARVLAKSASKTIRITFVLLILALAFEMIYQGLAGKF
jgi:uncharacterized membrane protein YfcA